MGRILKFRRPLSPFFSTVCHPKGCPAEGSGCTGLQPSSNSPVRTEWCTSRGEAETQKLRESNQALKATLELVKENWLIFFWTRVVDVVFNRGKSFDPEQQMRFSREIDEFNSG